MDRCSRCAGNAVPTAFGPPRSSAPSRAGTTPARRRPRRWRSWAAASTRRGSRRSTRRSSSTSSPPARWCGWWTASRARSSGRSSRSTRSAIPRAPRDWCCSPAPSPRCAGATFCEKVVELAEALGVQMVVTLGALLADVPHSRPVSVTAQASDPGLIERLALQPPTYEGPTGSSACCTPRSPTPGCPPPRCGPPSRTTSRSRRTRRARSRCCAGSRSLVGVTVDATDLEDAAERVRAPGHARRRARPRRAGLRRAARARRRRGVGPPRPGHLPSGDVLAREFQRFLRQRGEE